MAADRETTPSDGRVTSPIYGPSTPGLVVAEDYKNFIDATIDKLVEFNPDGKRRTDVNHVYHTAGGQVIQRRTGARRGRLLSNEARYINDLINFRILRLGTRVTRLSIERQAVELRSPTGGERQRETLGCGIMIYNAGDFSAHSKFSYQNIGREDATAYINRDTYKIIGRGVPLFDGTKAINPLLQDLDVSIAVLSDIASMLAAGSEAAKQPLTRLESPQNQKLPDPYDSRPGFGSRLLDRLIAH
jgi:hypothetical protein